VLISHKVNQTLPV